MFNSGVCVYALPNASNHPHGSGVLLMLIVDSTELDCQGQGSEKQGVQHDCLVPPNIWIAPDVIGSRNAPVLKTRSFA